MTATEISAIQIRANIEASTKDPLNQPPNKEQDLCMTCGKRVPSALWGGKCEPDHDVIHIQPCSGCGHLIGCKMDDDYCGPKVLLCPTCVNLLSQRTP